MLRYCLILIAVQILGSSCLGIGESYKSLKGYNKDKVQRRSVRAIIITEAEQAPGNVEIDNRNANKLVDFTINAVGRILKKFKDEEIQLPEKRKDIDKRFLGIRFRAYANFYNGSIKGLDSIHRIGDAMMIDAQQDESLGLVCNVELKDIEIKYAFKFSFMGIGPGGLMRAKLKNINIRLNFKMSPEGELTVDDFDVKDIGPLTVQTSGFGPFNDAFRRLGNIIGNLGKKLVLESLENKLKNLMNEALINLTIQ